MVEAVKRTAGTPFGWAPRMFGGWECVCSDAPKPSLSRGGDKLCVGFVNVVQPGSAFYVQAAVLLGEDGVLEGKVTPRIGAEPKWRRRLQAAVAEHWGKCECRDGKTRHLFWPKGKAK